MSRKLIKDSGIKNTEKEKKPFLMYDRNGEATEIEKCGLVYLADYDEVEAFKAASSNSDCVCTGIEVPGVYIWSDGRFEYVRILDSEIGHKDYLFNVGRSMINFSKTL